MGKFECFDIFGLVPPKYKIKKPIRLIELFGGIGAQSMALRNIGANFEHYKLVEFDKYPIASYNAIHGTHFEPMDIRDVTWKDLDVVDTDKYDYICTYSFPCQDISNAGLQKGFSKDGSTRSGLLWEVERILKELKEHSNLPQVLLMENVVAIHQDKFQRDFEDWERFLSKLGYSNHLQDLNAKDFGVAQNRDRAFMVSILGNYDYEFPEPIELTKCIKDYLEDEVDEKYYVKSERALQLIDRLVKDGKLDDYE